MFYSNNTIILSSSHEGDVQEEMLPFTKDTKNTADILNVI
jgi:hypothetical protein